MDKRANKIAFLFTRLVDPIKQKGSGILQFGF